MARGVALSCSGLGKTFIVADDGAFWRVAFGRAAGLPRVHALAEVDLAVPKGEFLGVLGRNGAGKSTLLRLLGGTYEPSAGSIVRDEKLASLYELGTVSNPDLTGRMYARRYLELTGSRSAVTALIADIESFSELGRRLDDSLRTYSAGMKARLFFACATAEQHELYLIDEVLSVGDSHFQSKCWRRIRDRLAGGASGVLVTHDWSAVLKLCRSACVLEHGRIIERGDAQTVVRAYLKRADNRNKVGDVARFRGLPRTMTWRSGDDCILPFSVESHRLTKLTVIFAIEKLMLGFGWEIMMLETVEVVSTTLSGRIDAELRIPRLPLQPGRYALGMNLVEVNPQDPLDRKVFDGIGWQDDDPIEVFVTGAASEAALALPGTWSMMAA